MTEHCKNGHERTPENTRVSSDGFRRCRQCQRAWLEGHREERQSYQREHRAANLEHAHQRDAAYHVAHRDQRVAYLRERYRRLKDAGLCVLCTKPSLSDALCWDCLTKREEYRASSF